MDRAKFSRRAFTAALMATASATAAEAIIRHGGKPNPSAPTAPTFLTLTGSSIVSNAAAGTVVGVLSVTGGTPPYTYTVANSKFTTSGNNLTRSASGTLTGGTPESVNILVTDANSLTYNTNGTQGPFSISVSAPGALSIPLTLNNLSPATSFAAPFVTYAHAFADGDIPAGGSVTATDSNSNPVTVQMDAVSNWPSGCPRWAVLSHACAETFAGGSAKVYTLGSSATAPNTTPAAGWGANPNTVLAANSDFKAVYSGFDAGSAIYTVSLNSIMAGYSRATAQNWGTAYPTGGWEYTKSGPVCVEFHGWQYIQNDSTGNYHGYVRCDIWVKAWSPTGPFEVDVRTSMPNIWNTVPLSSAAEQFGLRQGRWATALAVKNGATVIQSTGTTSDPNAVVVANANFNTTTNRITGTFSYGCGYAFSSTSALPAGIAANTVYFPVIYSGTTTLPYLAIDRAAASSLEQNANNWAPNTTYGAAGIYRKNGNVVYRTVSGGTSAASGGPTGTGSAITDGTVVWQSVTLAFADQGAGTITAFQVNQTYPSGGWVTGDINGDSIWSGTGTRPTISAGHDFTYLTTKSKFTPSYSASAGFQTTNQASPAYGPNANFGGVQWNLSATGDGAGDQRIGYVSNYAVASLFNPSDPYYARATIQAGLCWMQYGYNYMNDESGGNPFVGNNGTNNSGTSYTNLPPLIPAWNGNNIAGNVSTSVQPRGAAWSQWSQANIDFNGYGGQYYSTPAGSHMPATWQIAYMRSGRPCFLDQGIQMANTQCFMGYQGKQTLSGTTYYCLINGNYGSCQLRAWAWSWRSLCQAIYMLPQTHIFYPVLRDYYNDNAQFQANLTATFTAAQATFGMLRCLDHGGTGNTAQGHLAPWMGYFLYIVVAMEVWRGGLTGASAGTDMGTLLDYMAAQWNLYIPAVDPNAINYIGAYDIVYSPTTGGNAGGYAASYTTALGVFNASFAQVAQVTGSISGSVMTVTAVASGALALNTLIFYNNGVPAGRITSFGTGVGGTGTYNLSQSSTVTSQTIYGASFTNSVVPGPPYLGYLYDQNGVNLGVHQNFPENCNWYGSVARAALTMHSIARPSNTAISALKTALIAATAAATGQSAAQAGIQWYGTQTGVINNFQTFAIF